MKGACRRGKKARPAPACQQERRDVCVKTTMFDLLSRTRYGQIGLDIGADSVKMLQLAMMRGKPFVAAAALRHLPEDATMSAGDSQTRRRILIETIREILTAGVFHGRGVVSCMRADEISVKNIRLPKMTDEELASAAVWECQERFGFEVTPDRIHCINAGVVRQGADARNEVILIAVPDDALVRHLDILSESCLCPVHIDAEPTALFGAYERFLRRADDRSSVTVIVEIGLTCTRVVIARGRTILMIKTIDIAGRKFNESVAEELHIGYAEAASLRRRIIESGRPSTSPVDFPLEADISEPSGAMAGKVQWSVFDAIREQVETLAREISLCLRYCSVTFRGLRPSRIMLTGGEAYDLQLVESLNEYLDFECVVGQPLWGIDLGGVEMGGERRCELTEWSVAAGLALRGLYGKIGKDVPRSTGAIPTTASCKCRTTSGSGVGDLSVSESLNRKADDVSD